VAKSLEYELEEMARQAEAFSGLLQAKVAEYERMNDLLAPLLRTLAAFGTCREAYGANCTLIP
jgi:hypothetical protein